MECSFDILRSILFAACAAATPAACILCTHARYLLHIKLRDRGS